MKFELFKVVRIIDFIFEHFLRLKQKNKKIKTRYKKFLSNKMVANMFQIVVVFVCVIVKASFASYCSQNWSYLPNTKICIQFQNVSLPFLSTYLRCAAILDGLQIPSLLDIKKISNIENGDLAVLSSLPGAKPISFWTAKQEEQEKNCSFAELQNNTVVNIHSNANCSTTKLPFFCERSSSNARLGIEDFRLSSQHFSASSNYVQPNTLELMEYKPYFARLNRVFSEGLFQGAGWCSKTNSKDGDDEYFEIDFQGTVFISGLTLQYGLVGRCRVWITSFYIQYFRKDTWVYLSDSETQAKLSPATVFNTSKTSAGNSTTNFWFKKTLTTKRFRIVPSTSETLCSSENLPQEKLEIFCLRLEIFGFFFERENWGLVNNFFSLFLLPPFFPPFFLPFLFLHFRCVNKLKTRLFSYSTFFSRRVFERTRCFL